MGCRASYAAPVSSPNGPPQPGDEAGKRDRRTLVLTVVFSGVALVLYGLVLGWERAARTAGTFLVFFVLFQVGKRLIGSKDYRDR